MVIISNSDAKKGCVVEDKLFSRYVNDNDFTRWMLYAGEKYDWGGNTAVPLTKSSADTLLLRRGYDII